MKRIGIVPAAGRRQQPMDAGEEFRVEKFRDGSIDDANVPMIPKTQYARETTELISPELTHESEHLQVTGWVKHRCVCRARFGRKCRNTARTNLLADLRRPSGGFTVDLRDVRDIGVPGGPEIAAA